MIRIENNNFSLRNHFFVSSTAVERAGGFPYKQATIYDCGGMSVEQMQESDLHRIARRIIRSIPMQKYNHDPIAFCDDLKQTIDGISQEIDLGIKCEHNSGGKDFNARLAHSRQVIATPGGLYTLLMNLEYFPKTYIHVGRADMSYPM